MREGVSNMVEVKDEINGHVATGKANRIQACQSLLDWKFANRFDRDRPVLLLPGSWWSEQHEPEFESAGWWKEPTRRQIASNVELLKGARTSRSLVKTFTRCNWSRWRVLSV